MSKNNIGIRNVAKIGVADIDVYNSNKRKFDDLPPHLLLILTISVTVWLSSCVNKLNNKFWWEAGISAPKYYPVGDAKVDLEYSGNSSLTNFDNGWGDSYGSIVSGNKYKDLPRRATIQYGSAVENLTYQGTIPLPYDTILALFKKYCKDKENDKGYLIVGMAPGGWIRVWAYFSTMENGKHDDEIEIIKAQLKGKEDSTMGDGFRYKKSDYWRKYKTYWKHFGIPYDAWAENEKEYDLYFDFNKPNPNYDVFDVLYSSLDGTVYYNTMNDKLMKNRKLPADLVIAWRKKNDTLRYDTHILFPKKMYEKIKAVNPKEIKLSLEIEANNQAVLYLQLDKYIKEKILRFKNITAITKFTGDSDFCKEIEYFIK